MPISLIVGPPNSGRAPEIRRRLEEALDRDPVLVVPTGDDAARFERELCRGEATLGTSIRTFASLFEDVAHTVGLRLPPPLSEPQRLALVRAAVGATPLRVLARSARHAGFVPALDALISELEAALVAPGDLDATARDLDDGTYERELAAAYARYVDLRDRAGRSDPGSRAAATVAELRSRRDAWGKRPLFAYGFDDFTLAQKELLAELGAVAEVTVAVTYADREALKALAPLVGDLRDELAATVAATCERDSGHTDRETLRHLDRWLFEPGAPQVRSDGGVVMLESAGELGEAEAVGAEIARLIADGVRPDDIAVVARDLRRRGPAIGRTLARYRIPAAVETSLPLGRTAVGRSLVALCRAASPAGEPIDLLRHIRADPAMSPGAGDWLERRIRRERPASIDEAIATWDAPPRHLASVRAAGEGPRRMRVLAEVARQLAEAPHRERAPVVGDGDGDGTIPFEPLELRAASVAAELLVELAEVGDLPGCEPPDLAAAAEAIEGARVPLWRGPADGRVRVLDPHSIRAGRASHLFCIGLQEGEFPRPTGQHPLLSDERRARLGIPALIHREDADWERYLFHACASRPTERLYLGWQSSDDDGAPLARSPFIDEILDLIGPDPQVEDLIRVRGLEQVTFAPGDAPSERELMRSLAVRGGAVDGPPALERLVLDDAVRARVAAALAAIPDPDQRPGPLEASAVLGDLAAREEVSASSLEGWVECSYRWFVNHELSPQRLDPEPDPLRLGTVAHRALQLLYSDPPGDGPIPRPGDVRRWTGRFADLLDEAATEAGMRPAEPPDSVALARLRAQIVRFLREEAEVETGLRPRPELLEAKFGFSGEDSPSLDLGGIGLRGAIDRIDLAPDGRTALVRDYKTSTRLPGRKSWENEGKLQLQLYILAARESLGLDPIGGVYHPLGARKDRRPRGILLAGRPELEGLDLVGGDPCDADAFEGELERAREQAAASAAAMREGAIDRNPLGGRCPPYCAYQAICRIERAIGLEEDSSNGNGGS